MQLFVRFLRVWSKAGLPLYMGVLSSYTLDYEEQVTGLFRLENGSTSVVFSARERGSFREISPLGFWSKLDDDPTE